MQLKEYKRRFAALVSESFPKINHCPYRFTPMHVWQPLEGSQRQKVFFDYFSS